MFESREKKFASISLLIWDSAGVAPAGDWTTLHWQQYPHNNNPNDISIVQLVEQNADELRSKYLAWIYDLGETKIEGKRVIDHLAIRPGFSYWWTSSIGQKFNCSGTSQINDAIKALALEDFVGKHKFTDIFLTSDNLQLADCIDYFCQKNAINFQFKKINAVRKKSFVKSLFHLLPGSIKAVIFLLRYLVRTFPIYFVRNIKTPNVVGEVMFIDVLVHLDKQSVLAGKFRSNYWTELIDKLQRWDIKSNWAHLFFSHPAVPSIKQANHILSNFNSSSNNEQCHILVERPLKFNTLVTVISDFFKIRRSFRRLQSIREVFPTGSNLNLWALHADEWNNSLCGSSAIDTCLKLSLFLEMFASLPKQRTGVYISENQPWEMALIYAWKVSGHGKLIGTLHTTLRYWDLRYFYDSRSFVQRNVNDLLLPDVLAVNGPVAYKSILSSGYPSIRVVSVEALRYLHLLNKPTKTAGDGGLRVLVCGDFLEETTKKLLAWITYAAASLNSNARYIFKPHPAYPFNVKQLPLIFNGANQATLSDLLANCDVVFTSCITSAAVDAYLIGRVVIQMLSGENFNESPLRGLTNVKYVISPEDLLVTLRSIDINWKDAPEDYFFLASALPRWKNLLLN
jgi:surface carbohydrate biosynthesis protein (TIGR04326 family)